MCEITLENIKKHLPETLLLIRVHESLAKCNLRLFENCVDFCLDEDVNPEHDYGHFTSQQFMENLWEEYEKSTAMAKHLQRLVDEVKNDITARNS